MFKYLNTNVNTTNASVLYLNFSVKILNTREIHTWTRPASEIFTVWGAPDDNLM